jgi:hypothetical protein
MLPDAPKDPVTLAMPITSMHDHSSQAQLDNIIDSFKSFSDMYLRSIGKIDAGFWRNFTRKLSGAQTDHANDQKLLVKLLEQWKRLVDRELRGEQVLLAQNSPLELIKMITSHLREQAHEEAIDWENLPEREEMRLVSDAWRSMCISHGKDAFKELSDEEQFQVDLFVWSGCCMHKSLNTCKAGYAAMSAAWKTIDGSPEPVKLISKDKRDAMNKGTEEQRVRIQSAAQGGAIPHNASCGMVFKNQNDKKGQQDVYNMEYEVRFEDFISK